MATFDIATEIYRLALAPTIKHQRLRHEDFERFSKALRNLQHALGELAKEEYWRRYLFWLRRYCFDMSAAPLPFSWTSPKLETHFADLEHSISRVSYLFPDHAEMALALHSSWCTLRRSQDNPLYGAIQAIWSRCAFSECVILLKENRLVSEVEKMLISKRARVPRELMILSPSQLDFDRCYESLIIVGPIRWFPEHLITAPRAKDIYNICYSFIADYPRLEATFVSNNKPVWNTNWQEGDSDSSKTLAEGVAVKSDEDTVPADELVPMIDWKYVSDRWRKRHATHELYQEIVEARLLLLAGEQAVFVETADTASIMVIDLDGKDSTSESDNEEIGLVLKVKATQVVPGMFILLRTEGSGDYVVEVADKIMGTDLAKAARRSQEKWKRLLRERVQRCGLLETCIELLDLGSLLANETNVRNWMSPRSIRPSNDEDLHAITKLIGLEDEYKEIRNYASLIMSAHLRAGMLIRKQLLAQVSKSDLRPLRRLGKMEFVLSDTDGGSFTAFRVEEIAPETFQVMSSQLERPMPLVETLLA